MGMTNSGEHLSKYKMFRNFMYNELGITKDDIKEWVKEAVGNEVAKLIGQVDIDGRVSRNVRELITDRIHRYDREVFSDLVHNMAKDAGYSLEIKKRAAE